jgi:nucleoside-diphosphate-sugar epimerase
LGGQKDKLLPTIVVTGASGLVGRHFLEAARDSFYIYAVSRQSQRDAGVTIHDNIRWMRCDISDAVMVRRLFDSILMETTVDFIFHFAGYYDFTCREAPEYQRTNVEGTRHLLEGAERAHVKRFIFSSSLAVTDFSSEGLVISETSPADGSYPYARSKKKAEELVASFSGKFPCTVARLAAIFSDWCEYAPLYILLGSWLSKGIRSRLIGGRGETAIPYLHVQDLNTFWLQVIKNRERLSRFDILAAGPNGCVSHNELYAAATQAYSDHPGPALHVPVPLATVGVVLMRLLPFFTGRPVFERTWMMRYIDRRMVIDATVTHRLLDWAPKPRYHIMRRLLFLIENMKSVPITWERKNLAMTKTAVAERPGLKIYKAMLDLKTEVVNAHVDYLTAGENSDLYPGYQARAREDLLLRAELMYQMLESAMRLGDNISVLTYANYLARVRHQEGVRLQELSGSLEHIALSIEESLRGYPGLEDLQSKIHRETVVTMQLILDEVEDVYETLDARQTS